LESEQLNELGRLVAEGCPYFGAREPR
jgi:hypothetical protein